MEGAFPVSDVLDVVMEEEVEGVVVEDVVVEVEVMEEVAIVVVGIQQLDLAVYRNLQHQSAPLIISTRTVCVCYLIRC